MAALWPLCFCHVVSSSFYLLLLAYSQPSQIGCLPYFDSWCGLSANLRCRSETCCTRFSANTECKNSPKKLPSGHHCTTLSGYIFATKAHVDNWKKFVKQQYLLHVSSQYGKPRPTNGSDWFGYVGTPPNVNRFRILAALLHGTLVVGFSQILRR